MALNHHQLGDLVILKNGTFVDAADAATDPPTILCRVKDPTGVEVTYTFGIDINIEKLAAGKYRCTIKPTLAGVWCYNWLAIDASAAIVVAKEGAEYGQFYVDRSAFATV